MSLGKTLCDPVDVADTAMQMRLAITTLQKGQQEFRPSETIANRTIPSNSDWLAAEQRTIGWLEGAALQIGTGQLAAALVHSMHQSMS